jgi:MFS family permease
VVAGFGLASVYIAPLATFLIGKYGLSQAMMIFGFSFIVVVCGLAMLLVNPPEGYKPGEQTSAKVRKLQPGKMKPAAKSEDFPPSEIVKTKSFYQLWFMFFVGSGAGLIIIGSVAGMAKQSLGQLAWIVVALMAIGNASGRIVAGVLSDKIGRTRTLFAMLSAQGLIITSLLFISEQQAYLLVAAATLIGFNYGTNLSLFPSATKDYFGLKNFGMNYGLVFTAWGAGGFIFPRVSQMIVARTGSPEAAYIMAAFLLFLSAGLSFMTRAPKSLREKATIITELKPGTLYSGYFIYQPNYVAPENDAGESAAKTGGVTRLLPKLFKTRQAV